MKYEVESPSMEKDFSPKTWVGLSEGMALAETLARAFLPGFVEFEKYILTAHEADEQLVECVRFFECQEGGTPKSIERAINHLHILDIAGCGHAGNPVEKLVILGRCLKALYETKLKEQFPAKPCTVKFYIPEDTADLGNYRLSFWQKQYDNES